MGPTDGSTDRRPSIVKHEAVECGLGLARGITGAPRRRNLGPSKAQALPVFSAVSLPKIRARIGRRTKRVGIHVATQAARAVWGKPSNGPGRRQRVEMGPGRLRQPRHAFEIVGGGQIRAATLGLSQCSTDSTPSRRRAARNRRPPGSLEFHAEAPPPRRPKPPECATETERRRREHRSVLGKWPPSEGTKGGTMTAPESMGGGGDAADERSHAHVAVPPTKRTPGAKTSLATCTRRERAGACPLRAPPARQRVMVAVRRPARPGSRSSRTAFAPSDFPRRSSLLAAPPRCR